MRCMLLWETKKDEHASGGHVDEKTSSSMVTQSQRYPELEARPKQMSGQSAFVHKISASRPKPKPNGRMSGLSGDPGNFRWVL